LSNELFDPRLSSGAHFDPIVGPAHRPKAKSPNVLLFGTPGADTSIVRKILAISPDKSFLRTLRWNLEGAGYFVVLSDSLEECFLQPDQCDAFLVIVDTEALRDQAWESEKLLRWFHHRSPVLLLTTGQAPQVEIPSDCCLPKNVETEMLLSQIKRFQR